MNESQDTCSGWCLWCIEERGRVDTPCLPDGSCLDASTRCDAATYRCQCDAHHYYNGSQCCTCRTAPTCLLVCSSLCWHPGPLSKTRRVWKSPLLKTKLIGALYRKNFSDNMEDYRFAKLDCKVTVRCRTIRKKTIVRIQTCFLAIILSFFIEKPKNDVFPLAKCIRRYVYRIILWLLWYWFDVNVIHFWGRYSKSCALVIDR